MSCLVGVRLPAALTPALEVPGAGQLGLPSLPAQRLVQVRDVEGAQLHAWAGDHRLDEQLLSGEDSCGIGQTGVIKDRVCSVQSCSDVLLLTIIICSQSERVNLHIVGVNDKVTDHILQKLQKLNHNNSPAVFRILRHIPPSQASSSRAVP